MLKLVPIHPQFFRTLRKYLAFFEEEALGAYSDIRRLQAMGDDVIELKNPLNATVGFPQRFGYLSPSVEV